MKPEKIFYFSATHWDREWYRTVDEFRFQLVRVMDQVIHTLQNDPEFKIFTLDGQTSPLEDYLTVRPEKKAALQQLIREGKLVIGPWFTMPDEYLVSGESIIQNLLAGHDIANDYGAQVLKAGYVCDIFGHIANLPQILQGFGIDNALISRGTNDSDLECFFRWQSPDGSGVLTYKTPETCGYGSFFWEVLCPFAPDYEAHLDQITEKAIEYVERELTRTSLPYVILMDGMDHETIHPFMPQILDHLAHHFDCPVVQQRLDQVFSGIRGPMPTVRGELNAHCKENVMHNKLIPHTLSSRYDLKKANDACQTMLERYAMPCAALYVMQGKDPIGAYITHAYRQLLQNHAHDSICGCSIAAVHREMTTRFDKAWHTANEYFIQFSHQQLVGYTPSRDELTVQVFNPLPYAYQGLLELDIDFPCQFPATTLPNIKYEQRNAFHIFDEEEKLLPYNILHAFRDHHVRDLSGNNQKADTHRVALIGSLKPMGFTAFRVRPVDRPYRNMDRFSTGPNSCENEYIRFCIHADGTVQITDKETGRCYDRLHSFLDCAEIGDGWFHIRPIQDRIISSVGCPVSIEKIFDGYAACKFLVRYRWLLPEKACARQGFALRDGEYTDYLIESEFTVSRNSKLVTVKTTVHNSARDHRLQLHLPTGVNTDKYQVNQCNLILQRPCGVATDHFDWKEADISEYPFENMAFIRDQNCGLLFLSGGGLHEVSCPADAENSMDITLLRCFQRAIGTDGEDDGQLTGKQVFRYGLIPISTESDRELVVLKDRFVSEYRAVTLPGTVTAPECPAFTLQSENCAYITSMSAKGEGILLRIANYAATEDTCTLSFDRDISHACLCDFLQTPCSECSAEGNTVHFRVPPYKMVNLHVVFDDSHKLPPVPLQEQNQ